jgi:hypothetical protein
MIGRFQTVLVEALWLLPGLALAATLFLPPPKTGDALGLRRFRTIEVSPEYQVAQRFRMNAPGLNAIEIRPAAVGPVSGRFRLTLRDRDARNVERSAEVVAADFVRESRYLFAFDPIADSADHEYQLEIAVAPSDPGRGVALWATRGDRPEGSALRINNAPRWGSLAFQTATPSVSLFRRLLADRDPGGPPRWLAMAGLFGAWVAFRFVLKGVLAAHDPVAAASAVLAANGPSVHAFESVPATTAPDGSAAPHAAVQ